MDVDFSSQVGYSPPVGAEGVQPLCGFFVPGYPVRTDFVPADPTGVKRTLTLSCPGELQPPLASITELPFFLSPNAPLPTCLPKYKLSIVSERNLNKFDMKIRKTSLLPALRAG